jgi:hypothetical protein
MDIPHSGQAGLSFIPSLVVPEVNCLLHIKQRKRCFPVHVLPYLYTASDLQEGHLILGIFETVADSMACI